MAILVVAVVPDKGQYAPRADSPFFEMVVSALGNYGRTGQYHDRRCRSFVRQHPVNKSSARIQEHRHVLHQIIRKAIESRAANQ